MIYFGPSGNSESFYAEGYKSTWQAAEWLEKKGLNAFEYPFGRGVSLSDAAAETIRDEMSRHGIRVSAHAPYYINLSDPDPEKREKSFRYITEAAAAVHKLGGDRIVVHAGAAMKLERKDALENCRRGLLEALERLDDLGLGDVHICPETMGKYSQIGDLAEIASFCAEDERLIPCVDFAHLHALSQGGLACAEDMARVLDLLEKYIGFDRARSLHIHFSTIEYTAAGEKRHRTFAEENYGPRFELLAPLLRERNYAPVIICESKGTMAEDAAVMKEIYSGCI